MGLTVSERAAMPATYDVDISRELVPLSRAIVETSIRVMLASHDNGRLSIDGFINAIMILLASLLDEPNTANAGGSAMNDYT